MRINEEIMEIKKCTEADIQPVTDFYDKTVKWLDEHINYPKWRYKIYPSLKYVKLMTEEGSQYMCIDQGKVVGAFVLNDNPHGAYEKGNWKKPLAPGTYLVLHTLATDSDMYRQGIGTEVINFCIRKAKKEGYRAIRVDVVPDNDPAIRFYERNGFTWAGDVDLELGIKAIPVFSLLELNLPE